MVIHNIKNATQRQPSTNLGGQPTDLKGASNGNERNDGADTIHVLKRHAGLVPYQRLGIDATCATIISARSVQCMVYDIVPERLATQNVGSTRRVIREDEEAVQDM